MEECIFCKIIRGEIPCHQVYEDENNIAFLDINPVTEGHSLVVPKNHAENLYEISAEDLASVHQASQRVIRAIRQALQPTGVAVVQLNGRGVNQIIMHYHVHLIPRPQGSAPLVVSDMGAQAANQESLRKIAEKVSAAF
jgi:histidine triad (HIT) family protein